MSLEIIELSSALKDVQSSPRAGIPQRGLAPTAQPVFCACANRYGATIPVLSSVAEPRSTGATLLRSISALGR